jgi:hypothetical protein
MHSPHLPAVARRRDDVDNVDRLGAVTVPTLAHLLRCRRGERHRPRQERLELW